MDRKAKIYHCGRQLFGSKGFKNTNIAEIMKLAGMAAGTFYNYYPSKEMLFLDIYNEEKYSLQGTTQGNGLTGDVLPVRFSM